MSENEDTLNQEVITDNDILEYMETPRQEKQDVKADGEIPEEQKPLEKVSIPKLNLGDKIRGTNTDIFNVKEGELENKQIFSIKGTPSGRIQRHRDTSTVFPIGCMGCKEEPQNEVGQQNFSPRRFLDARDAKEHTSGHMESTPRKRPVSGKKDLPPRNPLTGEGMTSSDYMIRTGGRRREGNPVTGVGYEKDKQPPSGRIPPGGYSKGLW